MMEQNLTGEMQTELSDALYALRRQLKEELGDTTVIIVAQRISTILHADQIVVMDEGRMTGLGTHSELLQTCGTYREIAESQLSEEELKGGAVHG